MWYILHIKTQYSAQPNFFFLKQVYCALGKSMDCEVSSVPLGHLMKEQKTHEVQAMSKLTATLCNG